MAIDDAEWKGVDDRAGDNEAIINHEPHLAVEPPGSNECGQLRLARWLMERDAVLERPIFHWRSMDAAMRRNAVGLGNDGFDVEVIGNAFETQTADRAGTKKH